MSHAQTIAGRYRVEGRLGVGGMSTVHLAFDDRLERYVALKLLAEHLADDPTFVSRFRREALAAARLVHPNIVQVFDFGFDEGQHQHFIVMEHVQGHSCAELLRERGHLDVDEAVEIISQGCRGLDYAHRHGVVHRDVKPGNLLVSDGKAGGGPASGAEVVKLADFGIARALGQSSITQVGSVLGTAAYLAPEQARGEEAGPRADIYSLGVVAYQLLSGRLPYEASSLSELALKQQREAPLALEDLDPQIPRPLARAVGAALALDQEDRPADTIVFAEALRRGAQGVEASGAMPVAAEGTRATRVLRGEDAPLHGDAPPAGRERDAPTAATRAARPAARGTRTADPATVARPARRLEPRPYAGAAGPAADHVPEQRRSGKAGRRFAIALAVLLLFVAAVAAAVAISTNTSKTAVQIRNVIAHDTQSAINQVQNLIGQNTK